MTKNSESTDALVVKRAKQKPQMVVLGQIFLTDEFRFRVEDDENTIAEYEGIYGQFKYDHSLLKSEKCPLDAITVLREEEGKYLVVAGRLRFLAAQRADLATLPCIVITDRKEAFRIGLESNKHGLPLNRQDRVNCTMRAIAKLPDLSNRTIARMIGCSARTVDEIVKTHHLRSNMQLVKGQDGKAYNNVFRGVRESTSVGTAKRAEGVSMPLEAVTGTEQTAGVMCVNTTSKENPVEILWTTLEPLLADDQQRVHTCLDFVKTVVSKGFTDEKQRQEFLRLLETELFDGKVA